MIGRINGVLTLQTIPLLITNPNFRHRGVVIAGPFGQALRPCIDVHVLNLGATSSNNVGDKHMIKLMHMLLVNVCVTVNGIDMRRIVDISKEGFDALEDTSGVHQVIHVSRKNDTRVWVPRED